MIDSSSYGFIQLYSISSFSAADEPKTSEYAFFKKLKTDAGQRFKSHPVHQEEVRPNKFQAWDCPTGSLVNDSFITNECFLLYRITYLNSLHFLAGWD